jgi:hypothetical protein
LFLVDLGYRKFSHRLIAPDHRMQRDTAPDNGSILEHFCRHVVDISLLVPDSSGFDDVEFFVLPPGSTHVHEL